MDARTKKLVTLAMFAALAYAAMALIRIPVVLFLKYEPKDVIITIAGFLYGPVASLIISLVVGFVEMITVSDTGWIGMIMNVISSCAFCCTAAVIYKRRRTLQGAIMGLVAGTVLMTVVMLLWNYLITPIYMGYPREAVAAMLLPAFLPFNLVKAALNSAITMLLYKPVVTALRRSGLVEKRDSQMGKTQKSFAVIAGAVFVIATAVVVILVLSNKI
ncbi:MAG: ECF transporter S component, partial [Lachnospiraceae bacterium]|nr:ECF transporter S component [Lachnospiraceae bacterium]MBR0154218.1 ECF transporter S component [Lachnospiraceae bacterium]